MTSVLPIIADIYRCPGSPDEWTRTARDIADHLGARHLHLVVMRPGGTIVTYIATDRAACQEYVRDYAARDIAIPYIARVPPGRAAWSRTLLPAAALDRCPVQNELSPKHRIGSRTWIQDDFAPGTSFATGILHHPGSPGLGPRQTRRAEQLHAHLKQAMHLHLAIQDATAARLSMEAGLDAMAAAFILLRGNGTVLFANRSARALFEAGRLRLAGGCLALPTLSADPQLRRLLATALAPANSTGASLDAAGPAGGTLVAAGLRMHAVPLTGVDGAFPLHAAAALFLQDATTPAPNPDDLADAGLTRSEAELTLALARGETLGAYAARTGRAIGTVRAQLRATFAKTDTGRQSELVLYALRVSTTRRP